MSLLAALVAAGPLSAQVPASTALPASSATPLIADLSTTTPVAGRWTYALAPDGSVATFIDAGNRPQIELRCARSRRTLALSRPAAGAAPFLQVWTSSLSRNLPAAYTPATTRLTASLPAFDPVFDALAMSRGRIGVAISGQPPLTVVPWAELIRVVEDCRS